MISACHLLPSPAHLECQSKLVCRVREASSDCYLSTLGSIANRSLSRFFLIYYLVLLPRIPVAPPGRPVVVPPDISSRSSFAFSVHSVHISSSIERLRGAFEIVSRRFHQPLCPSVLASVCSSITFCIDGGLIVEAFICHSSELLKFPYIATDSTYFRSS